MLKYSSILAAIAALLLAAIWGCTKSGTEAPPPPQTKIVYSQSACLPGSEFSTDAGRKNTFIDPKPLTSFQSLCLGDSVGDSLPGHDPGGAVRFVGSHDTLFVYHDTAFYNCCSHIVFALEKQGSTLDFIEVDTATNLCPCMCYFDLHTAAPGLSPGAYLARLWTEDKEILLGEEEVTIDGVNNVRFETRCDTLFVYHDDRLANCGSLFVFDFQQHDHQLIITEIDTSSAMLRCMCDFNISAQVSGLNDGIYTVQLWDGGNAHGFNPGPDSLIVQGEIEISCP